MKYFCVVISVNNNNYACHLFPDSLLSLPAEPSLLAFLKMKVGANEDIHPDAVLTSIKKIARKLHLYGALGQKSMDDDNLTGYEELPADHLLILSGKVTALIELCDDLLSNSHSFHARKQNDTEPKPSEAPPVKSTRITLEKYL